jgi:UDP-galactopyranose mutase
MALPLGAALPRPLASVYDCMDELSGFHGAPKNLLAREQQLLSQVDVVFTGGHALFEAKRHLHHNVHPFPSSVDAAHFAKAREPQPDPADQAGIGGPRLGFFGVIDERMDLSLLEGIAQRRPNWQLVMLGPVVKIDPSSLPRLPNIHYLGAKAYADLPRYVAGWDVAIMPFAKNEATRYISPTKAPEYLAAGKPVVSTSIRDVVRPYSVQGLAHIADTPADFVAACEACMSEPAARRLRRVDAFLSRQSWDKTWEMMDALMRRAALLGALRGSEVPQLLEFDDARLEVG